MQPLNAGHGLCPNSFIKLIASAKRAAKRLAKRALLTNVYLYRKGRTEAKAKANHTYSLTKIRRHAKAEPEIPWSKLMDNCHGGSCDLKLAKMYVIEKCCNGYRPRSCKHSSRSLFLQAFLAVIDTAFCFALGLGSSVRLVQSMYSITE